MRLRLRRHGAACVENTLAQTSSPPYSGFGQHASGCPVDIKVAQTLASIPQAASASWLSGGCFQCCQIVLQAAPSIGRPWAISRLVCPAPGRPQEPDFALGGAALGPVLVPQPLQPLHAHLVRVRG